MKPSKKEARDIKEAQAFIKRIDEIMAKNHNPKKELGKKCLLFDPMVIVAPQDEGEPPCWVPAYNGERVFWLDRKPFEELKARREEKPCNICPVEIHSLCQYKGKY